jgi:hypothetical protein
LTTRTLRPADDAVARADRRQDIALKRRYATWLLGILVAQLVVADLVFVVYAHAGREWALTTAVVDSWLAATLIEIVGIVYVVTQHLSRGRRPLPRCGAASGCTPG